MKKRKKYNLELRNQANSLQGEEEKRLQQFLVKKQRKNHKVTGENACCVAIFLAAKKSLRKNQLE